MKDKMNESDEDFNKRCIKVWNTLCEKADKYDVIQVKDSHGDDDYNQYDCEYEIEEMIEQAENK